MTDNSIDDENWTGPATERADLAYEFDEDERPSEAVVRAVASLTNTNVIDLDPLYDAIDTDHLNGLFDDPHGTRPFADRSVAFRFEGCTVTVTPDTVYVRKCDGEDDRSGTD